MSVGTFPFIKQITVEKLFGLYDYSLSISETESEHNRILILYGDNGSGKTTILKLAFHLLAPEERKGHKSRAAAIPFRRFQIDLLDGTTILAQRTKEQLIGSFSMTIKHPKKEKTAVNFIADERFSVQAASEEQKADTDAFLTALRELEIGLYLLSDDRQIRFAGREQEPRPRFLRMDLGDERVLVELESGGRARSRGDIDPERMAQYLLLKSIERAESWIRSRAMKGSSMGESSVNALYNEIVKRLAAVPQREASQTTSTKALIQERVSKLEKQCSDFAQYGLMPQFHGNDILAAVRDAHPGQLRVIAEVLDPYLESMEKKLDAQAETHRRVNSFVTIINRFLANKTLRFDLHSGLAITAEGGTSIEPPMLSSGERHLFLLFCNSLVAVDRPSIMMIDEPEISLNVKWQRKLLSSLLECIGDSPVQYIFATHSMEVLAQHRDRVLKLEHVRRS